MQEISKSDIEFVAGAGALGSAVGTVIGSLVGGAAVAAITITSGGVTAPGAVSAIGAIGALGGVLGSAIEDAMK